MDFNNYILETLANSDAGVYGLAGRLLGDIADAFNFDLGERPTEKIMSELIAEVAPNKLLQENIGPIEERLGSNIRSMAAKWLERSGCLYAVSGAFVAPRQPIPGYVDAVVMTGGVANWMLRRRNVIEYVDPNSVGKVVLAAGNREMGKNEHPLVRSFPASGRPPTEYEFIEDYVAPLLRRAGHTVAPLSVESSSGTEVCSAVFEQFPNLLQGTVLAVGNAPSVIQTAGQLRAAACQVNPGFDQNGDQLFMRCDSFPVARNGEPKETHQDPLSGIGQIVRNAKFLHLAAATV